jgi:signal transduction histidine kinase
LPYLPLVSKWLQRCGICLALLLVPVALVFASPFQKRLIDNNLPNVGIYSIVQDKQGFLWLASTNTGLVQFDGYDFQQFPILNQTLTQLKSVADIGALAVDHDNNLWAGSWGYGLARLNATDNSIKVFNGSVADALASPFVQTLFEDAQNRLWIGTTKGINRYSDAEGLILLDTSSLPAPNPRTWAFAQTPDGAVWVATSAGLFRWHDDDGFSTALYPHGVDSSDNEVRVLHVVGDNLWVGTRNGVMVYQSAEQHFIEITPPPGGLPWVNTMLLADDSTLLVGTFGGIYAINPHSLQFQQQYQQQWAELPNINVRSLFVGKSSVLWVGTRENGLFYKTVSSHAFQNSADEALLALQQSLDAPVLALLAEQDTLWLGQNGRVIQYQHQTGQQQHFAVPGRVNSIQRAPDNTLWIGADEGLFQLTADGSLNRLSMLFQRLGLPEQNARDIKFTDNGQVLVNLWSNGVMLYDFSTGQLQHFLGDIARTTIGDSVQATAITERYIWLASRLSGAYLIDRKNFSVKRLTDMASAEQLAAQYTGQLTCITKLNTDSVAICTERGLMRLSERNFVPSMLNAEHGLDAEFLVSAFSVSKEALWLSSTQGLYLIKPGHTMSHFSTEDGLQSDNLMFNAMAQDSRHLYLGSDAGLELVNPRQLRENLEKKLYYQPKPLISNVLFEQKRVARSLLQPLTELDVPPGVSRIEFLFSSFDFNAPQRSKYRYKLQGYDADWQQLNSGHVATYTNLPPGNYQLHMRASNSRGQFGDHTSTLAVNVFPHWWQHRVVQGLALVSALCLLSWVVWQRMARINQHNRQLEAAVTARTAELQHSLQQLKTAYDELQQLDLLKDQFISTVSHELRTPLTAISGALQLVLSGALAADKDKMQQLLNIANSNSKRLTLLINDLLDLEKLAANKMTIELTAQSLQPIVQRAVDENSTYGLERQVSLHYQHDTSLNTGIALVNEHRLLQVLANLLSNAIKFSPAGGDVTILLQREGDIARISIIDQGPGIPEEFQPRLFQRFAQASSGNTRQHGGTGLGLALSRELMHAMHGDISFDSVPGEGSRFHLTLPLQQ